jgi:hypothetical protein
MIFDICIPKLRKVIKVVIKFIIVMYLLTEAASLVVEQQSGS